MSQTLFREFAAGDASVAAFGQEVEKYKKLAYSKKIEGTLNHSGNNSATSYSLGKKTQECKIEVYMSQLRIWEGIRKEQTGSSDITGMTVELAVTYANDDLEETTDTVSFVILSQGRAIEGGADGLVYELETLCLGVEIDV